MTSDVEVFRPLVEERTGIRVADDKLPLLEDLLRSRIRETGETSVLAYLERVRAGQAEMRELARSLTVSETYFLRGPDQFRALESIVLDAGRSARPLRVLSAGCSSGEEPYSMAMVLRELQAGEPSGASIVAFDLNPDALARARAGEYSAWSLRETPQSVREKYFLQKGTKFLLDEAVRRLVSFEERNLVDPDPAFWRPEVFDVVFCRNVIMYFSPEAARRVVRRIARSLRPGGFLFLGHAENLRGLSRDFHLLHTHETFYYQRRPALESPVPEEVVQSAVAAPVPIGDGSWFDAINAATRRIAELARDGNERNEIPEDPSSKADLEPALGLLREERYRDALALLGASSHPGHRDPERLLLRAVLLATSGESRAAEEACAALLEIDELNAGAHYVIALCREHAGDRGEAVEHDRLAAYLDPDFAMPHLHLGLLARRAGDRASARRELELARDLLSREDDARILLFGGGFGREALIRLCGAELRACGGGRR